MLLGTYYNGVEIHRREKIIYARFLFPHRVISTCRVSGGIHDELVYLFNHQSCEPTGHQHGHLSHAVNDPLHYRQEVCDRYALPAEQCATLGTAANMNMAAIHREQFRDLTVVAVCTGGVESNAGRVGDPASVMETEKGFEKLVPAHPDPKPGTINTMIFINKALIPGAMVRVIMTATEAKSAALQELAVGSRYSDGLATGTGTDQIGVAAMLNTGNPLTSAGKHVKLGELIGKAVHRAIKETLGRQNGLTPASQCSCLAHLKRLGLDQNGMIARIGRLMDSKNLWLFKDNFRVIDRDPVTAGAVGAMVHVRDMVIWKILPAACWPELMIAQAALVAAAVSGRFSRTAHYRREMAPVNRNTDNRVFTDLVCRAIALGFQDKWEWPSACEAEEKDGTKSTRN